MPITKLQAEELSWFDIARYEPLRSAPSDKIIQVIRDRRLLCTYVTHSSALSVLSPGISELAQNLRPEVAFLPTLLPLFEKLRKNPLEPLFSLDEYKHRNLPLPMSSRLMSTATVHVLSQQHLGFEGDLHQPHEGPESHLAAPIAYVQVDLRATDRDILDDFKTLLGFCRDSFAPHVSNRDHLDKLRSWSRSGVIPLIDLEIFRLIRQQEIRDLDPTAAPLTLPRKLLLPLVFPNATLDQQQASYENALNHRNEVMKNPYLLQTLSYLKP